MLLFRRVQFNFYLVLHFQRFHPLYLLQSIIFYHDSLHPKILLYAVYIVIAVAVISCNNLYYLYLFVSLLIDWLIDWYINVFLLLWCVDLFGQKRGLFGRFFNPWMLRNEGVSHLCNISIRTSLECLIFNWIVNSCIGS